jgi:hypothetical protein
VSANLHLFLQISLNDLSNGANVRPRVVAAVCQEEAYVVVEVRMICYVTRVVLGCCSQPYGRTPGMSVVSGLSEISRQMVGSADVSRVRNVLEAGSRGCSRCDDATAKVPGDWPRGRAERALEYYLKCAAGPLMMCHVIRTEGREIVAAALRMITGVSIPKGWTVQGDVYPAGKMKRARSSRRREYQTGARRDGGRRMVVSSARTNPTKVCSTGVVGTG